MVADKRGWLRVQAQAWTTGDLESVAGEYPENVVILRDGAPLGRGPEAVRRLMEEEAGSGLCACVAELDGEPVLASWQTDEPSGPPSGVLAFEADDDGMATVHLRHDAATMGRVRPS